MKWPSGGKLSIDYDKNLWDEALSELNEIIKTQRDREIFFLTSIGLAQYSQYDIITPELLKNQVSEQIPPELISLMDTLQNQLEKQDISSDEFDKLIKSHQNNSAQKVIIYDAIKNRIVDIIKTTVNSNENASLNTAALGAEIANALKEYYDSLLKKAEDNKDNTRIIENSFSKIFAILSRAELNINPKIAEHLKQYSNYPVSNDILEMKQGLQKLQNDTKGERLKREKRRMTKIDAKVIKIEQDGKTLYELNFGAIIKSVTQSITGITSNLRGKALEELISRALQQNQTTFAIGSIPLSSNVELTGDARTSGGIVQSYGNKIIDKYKQTALKYGRNAKADVTYSIGNASFGISAKAGQEERIKIDTRGSFYSFLNFIGHYKYGAPIAESLENENNIETILGTLTPEGFSYSFSELNKALSVIAYSFFGYVDDNASIDLTYFYGADGELSRYQNNAVIFTDKGEIKKISPYLEAIKQTVLMDAQKQFNLSATFSVDSEKKTKYQKSIWGNDNIYEAMQYVSVQTFLNQ